jgi:hydrogenase small subunit
MFSIKITRRQFLKWLSASAAAVGMSQTDLLKFQNAFAAGPPPNPSMPIAPLAKVIWITGQDCGGCATTILNYLANPSDEEGVLHAVANNALGLWSDIEALYPVSNPGANFGPDLTPLTPDDVGDGDIDIAEVVLEVVAIEWAYIVMAGAGDVSNDYLLSIVQDGGYVLMMDGAIPTNGAGNYCKIMDVKGDITLRPDWPTAATPYVHTYTTTETTNGIPPGQTRTEVTMAAASLWLANNANAVVCMGTCNSWGGIPAAKGGKTGAKSGWEWINQINGMNKVIANVPGCAPNPDWFIHTVAAYILETLHPELAPTGPPYNGHWLNLDPGLDHKGRPKLTSTAIYHPDAGYVFCEDCPRRTSQPGPTTLLAAQKSAAHPDGQCLFTVGCNGRSNGPQNARADCPTRKWNPFEDHSKNNWCVGNNMPCQGCTDPGFPDLCSPFYDSHKNT